MAVGSNSLYALYQLNQEVKILEKEIDTLQETDNFLKSIDFQKLRDRYVLTKEEKKSYAPAGYDNEWYKISDFFDSMGTWDDSLSERIESLKKEIEEKKVRLFNIVKDYRRELNNKLKEIEDKINNSNNNDETKKLYKDRDELKKIINEIDSITVWHLF